MSGRSGFEVVASRNGPPAMRDRQTGEVMHPGTGPGVEAMDLYVTPSRLERRLALDPDSLEEAADELVLFDVGLGAASNAIAAWNVSESLSTSARRLRIISFENELGALELALSKEHAESFGLTGGAAIAARSLLTRGHHETARTTWKLAFGDFHAKVEEVPRGTADIVFWDFYSPKADATLWSARTLRSARQACRAGATLHTYCAATSFRAGLLLAGFAVGFGERTGARPETTVAAVDPKDIARPLDARWLERLARSHVPFPTDVPREAWPDALATIQNAPQFRRA